MDYQVLRDEIDTDPLTRGYSGMTNLEIADDINLEIRSIPRDTMSSSEVFNSIDSGEFDVLSADDQQEVWNILHLGELNPFGLEATRFIAIFGGGSNTITTLAASRNMSVSRGTEIGIGHVREGDVEKAKAL